MGFFVRSSKGLLDNSTLSQNLSAIYYHRRWKVFFKIIEEILVHVKIMFVLCVNKREIMTIGQQIKARREHLSLTQGTLCQTCEMTTRALQYIESDNRLPTKNTLSKICDALKVEIILKPTK